MPEASALPLSSAALAGGVAAEPRLERMFRAHHDLIWRTLRRLGMNQDAAADGTQQAFLVAAERLQHIRPGAERAFLFGTALRIARSARRKTERYELEGDMDVRVDPDWRTDAMTNRHAALQLLDRMLLRMDPDLVTVFVLFELEGMSTGEIAGMVGIPVGTAASRLRRARQTFRSAASRLESSRAVQKRSRRIVRVKRNVGVRSWHL
jgi:RNA polymerase sigma-70 factor (ECF subfamily)